MQDLLPAQPPDRLNYQAAAGKTSRCMHALQTLGIFEGQNRSPHFGVKGVFAEKGALFRGKSGSA